MKELQLGAQPGHVGGVIGSTRQPASGHFPKQAPLHQPVIAEAAHHIGQGRIALLGGRLKRIEPVEFVAGRRSPVPIRKERRFLIQVVLIKVSNKAASGILNGHASGTWVRHLRPNAE